MSDGTKSIFRSKTLWGLALIFVSMLGVDLEGIVDPEMGQLILESCGLGLAGYGRMKASEKLA